MTSSTAYATRHREILDALGALDPAAITAAVPNHWVDQVKAAAGETRAMLHHVGRVEHALNPARFNRAVEVRDDWAGVDDVLARILAAMGDGHWTWCPHLRRTPAQPAHVQLALRRVACNRCAGTVRRPPSEEADRCDLCGSCGNATFWPVRFALTSWLVIGDMCRGCAAEIQPEHVESA